MSLTDMQMRWGVDLDGLSGPFHGNILNDAAGEAWAFSLQAPMTGTIEAVVFRVGTVTSFQNMTISLETLGTNGLPSGSNYGGSSPGTWSGGTSNTSPEVSLAGSASATVGDLLCVRGEWAGTNGNLNVQYVNGSSAVVRRFPKVMPNTGSGFSLTTTGIPMILLKYSGSQYLVPLGCWPPISEFGTTTINSGTSPQEVGFWLTPPAAVRIRGCAFSHRTFGTTQNSTLSLYSAPAGTPVSQRSFVANHNQQSSVGHHQTFCFNPYELAGATDYVLAKLQASTDSMFIYTCDVADVNHWGGWAGGSNLVYASRNSGGGAYTKLSTRKLLGSIWFDQVHSGSGGGGGVRPAGRGVGLVSMGR